MPDDSSLTSTVRPATGRSSGVWPTGHETELIMYDLGSSV